MDVVRQFLRHDWMKLLIPGCVMAVTLFAGFLARRAIFRALRGWAARNGSRPALILTEALYGPFLIWMLILALHLAIESSDLPRGVVGWGARIFLTLWILSVTVMFARLAGNLIRYYGSEIPGAMPVTTLTQNLAQVGVAILGMLVLLNQLNISITPILTALGVGGLAVALALQDTLSNLFAGFYVAVAGQVRLNDYIKLNTGEEGYVADIGWRSTSIRALANNLIIVPNSKLAQAVVTNYHLPEKRMSLQVTVPVAYGADPDHVERVLGEIARAAAREIPGVLATPEPTVAFDPGFSDAGMVFAVNCQVAEFVQQFSVRSEIRRRIVRAFQREGIHIPSAARALLMQEAEKKN